MVGKDLVAPTPQGLREGAQLGPGGRVAAPGDRPIERSLGLGGVVGDVDVAHVLLGNPGVLQLPVEVAVTQRLMESFPALFVEVLGAHQQQLADPVERVAFPAAMLQRCLLNALAALRHSGVGETNDVERIDHDRHVGKQLEPGDRRSVALVRIDRHHADLTNPVVGL